MDNVGRMEEGKNRYVFLLFILLLAFPFSSPPQIQDIIRNARRLQRREGRRSKQRQHKTLRGRLSHAVVHYNTPALIVAQLPSPKPKRILIRVLNTVNGTHNRAHVPNVMVANVGCLSVLAKTGMFFCTFVVPFGSSSYLPLLSSLLKANIRNVGCDR